jgi:UDP-glucuronate decarboxylase
MWRGRTLSLIDKVRLSGRVLVTGCAGFIGSWLAEALVASGAEVYCVDNFSTGRLENLSAVLKDVTMIKGNVEEVDLPKFDLAFHGAALPAPDYYVKRPVEAMLPDSFGLYRVLRAAAANNARVVYMSSSEVYGDPEVVPTPESYWGRVNPVGPRSPYDESKRFGEALSMAFRRQYGLDVRIVRIFNTYGPRLDPDGSYARVVTKFLMQALKGDPITVHGDGSQTRSFAYVSDIVNGLLLLAKCERCGGEVYNLGSDEEITILELARLVKEVVGSSSPIVFTEPRPDDPRRRRPDVSKIRALGWAPRVKLKEGLELTLLWLRSLF